MACRVIFGIFCVIITTTWIVSASNGEEESTGVDEVCQDEQCHALAQQIERQMGKYKPCKDFHGYVCGKWKGSQELQASDLKKKAVLDLVDLLESAHAPSTGNPNATEKLVLAYKSCTKKGKDKEALRRSTEIILKHYGLDVYPIVEDEHAASVGETYQQILKNAGPRPVFRYFASKDETIVLTKPNEFYVLGSNISSDYDDLYDTSDGEFEDLFNNTELGGKSHEEAYKEFIVDSILLLNESVTEQHASGVADGIIAFEKSLSEVAGKAEKEQIHMTLSGLRQKLSGFPIEEILQKDFGVLNVTLRGDTAVTVEYLDYYEEAVKFLKSYNNTATLKNYISWTKIRRIAEAEETSLHEIYLKYKNHTLFLEESKGVKLDCVHQLLKTDIMYSAGASYYSSFKFDKHSKKDVLKMMDFLNATFRYVIRNNSWMSKTTKRRALRRLRSMELVIGYPDWMLESDIMNALYRFVPRIGESSSYVEHFHWLHENSHFQELLRVKSEFFDKKYEDVALKSHAYYTETTETLVYPAAALVTHYRKPPIPRAINFGTIGTNLAQLLTNTIDRFDFAYNGTRKITQDFWDNMTRRNFCDRSLCLKNTEKCEVETEKRQILRDYLGIRVAYKALRRSKKSFSGPFLLPGRKFKTESKIFFILFGSLYCPFSVNEQMIESRKDNEDDTFKKSLNEIVYHYKDFNTTFRCNVTANVDTCRLID